MSSACRHLACCSTLLMRRVTPFVLALLAPALLVRGVELSVPLRCGGTRIVTHAAAKFGRQLLAYTSPELLPAFAPRPVQSPRKARRRWGPFRRRRRNGGVDILALAELCAPIEHAVAEQHFRGKVVFALRGRCDFARKALLAEAAGAVAVVVVNARKSSQLVNMKLNDSLVLDGIAPCRELLSVALTSDGEAVHDIDYGREALNWAFMRGMALWILCQCGVNVARYKRRLSENRARAQVIAKMPSHVFQELSENERLLPDADVDPVCPVCLEGFENGEHVRALPCSHLYHRKCIDPWLQTASNSCPICKRQVCGLPPPPSRLSYGTITV